MIINKFNGIETFNLVAPEEMYLNVIPKGDRIIQIPTTQFGFRIMQNELDYITGSFLDRDNNFWFTYRDGASAPNGNTLYKCTYDAAGNQYYNLVKIGPLVLSTWISGTTTQFAEPTRFVQSSAPTGTIYILSTQARRNNSGNTQYQARIWIVNPSWNELHSIPSTVVPSGVDDSANSYAADITYYDNRLYALDLSSGIIAASSVNPDASTTINWAYQVYSSDISAKSMALIAFGGFLYYFTNRNIQRWTRTGQLNEPIQLNTSTVINSGGKEPIIIADKLYFIGNDSLNHQFIGAFDSNHAFRKISNKQVDNLANNQYQVIRPFCLYEDLYIACFVGVTTVPRFNTAYVMDAESGYWWMYYPNNQNQILYSITHDMKLRLISSETQRVDIRIDYEARQDFLKCYENSFTQTVLMPNALRTIINLVRIRCSLAFDITQQPDINFILRTQFGHDGLGQVQDYPVTMMRPTGQDEYVAEVRKLGSAHSVKFTLFFYKDGELPATNNIIQIREIEIS